MEGRFASSNQATLKQGAQAKRLAAGLERRVDVLVGVGTALVLWFGALQVRRGAITPGDLVVFLLYLKTATYIGNPLAAPVDVMEYGSRSPLFPHESTSDQFFKESQLESYRALGEHEIGAVMGTFAKHVPGLFTAAVLHIRGQRGDGIEK